MQSVSVDVNRSDLLVFQFRSLWVHPVNRLIFALLFVFCFVTSLKSSAPKFDVLHLVIAAVVGLIFTAAGMLLGFAVISVLVLRGGPAQRGSLGEHTFSLTELGLVESSRYNETLIKWGGAHRLLRTPRMIYVQMNAGIYHLIPRRFFASAEDDEKFWAAIQPLLTSKTGS